LIHAVAYSGGKDSTALILWAKENLPFFVPIFCDTGWEHKITLAYIEKINREVLGNSLVVLKSKKYEHGMTSLVQIKGRVPSARARFCTEKLKVLPMKEWVEAQEDEVTIYLGVRADESEARSHACEREWSDLYDCYVERPLLHWTAEQCFAYAAARGVEPNPLYLMGARRIGCFPCVMITHGELRRLTDSCPEIWGRIAALEIHAKGKSFFPPNFIPERFQTGRSPKSGKCFARAEDVKKYVMQLDQSKLDFAPGPSCMSVYNLCE
jgi:3'-phosphoadenosine 5'-phosphosulfate sulfotransferase (PAPS reductase)/FAD synthetase